CFEPLELAHQLIEFVVGDDRLVQDVVSILVLADLSPQFFDAVHYGLFGVSHSPVYPGRNHKKHSMHTGDQIFLRLLCFLWFLPLLYRLKLFSRTSRNAVFGFHSGHVSPFATRSATCSNASASATAAFIFQLGSNSSEGL